MGTIVGIYLCGALIYCGLYKQKWQDESAGRCILAGILWPLMLSFGLIFVIQKMLRRV